MKHCRSAGIHPSKVLPTPVDFGQKSSGKPVPLRVWKRDTLDCARMLPGYVLCRRIGPGRVLRALITEVEAYDGPQDRACHASKGKTQRTAVMFEGGGRWYVYLCYGVHWMLNLVVGKPGYPAALLIRSAGPIIGPGRLTRDLAIDGSLNGARAVRVSGLWIEPPPKPQGELGTLCSTPRIGIDYAGPEWVARPYRFLLR